MVYWTNSKTNNQPKHIKIDGKIINISTSVKYLGIIIDNKLNWNEHIQAVVNKCKKALFAAKRAIGKKWGISPKQMMWIYKTIIIPILSYGAVIWAMNLTKTQTMKINAIQTLAQHMITRCKTSTPKVLLSILLNMLPLENKLESIALKRALTLKTEGHWNTNSFKKEKYQTTQEKIDWILKDFIKINPNLNTDKIGPVSLLSKKYNIKIENRNEVAIKDCQENILIFTDGSKNLSGQTGYGITFSEEEINEISEPLLPESSIFQAEAIAIWQASKIINQKNLSNLNLEFYTDSQAVLNSLQKRNTKNEIIKNCHITLNELGKNNKVNLNWIPGHEGYEGNERADHLAKIGSLKQPANPIYDKIPFKDYENKIDKYYQNSILNRYKYSGISEEAKILTNQLLTATKYKPNEIAKRIILYPNNKLEILIKVLSNHNNLNYHMTRTKLIYNEYCEYCTEVMKYCDPNWKYTCIETAEHILCTCTFFNNLRKDTFNVYQIKTENLHELTKNVKCTTDRIIKFLDKSKVLERKPQTNKRDLSPNRIINQGRNKRINSTDKRMNPNKRTKTTPY